MSEVKSFVKTADPISLALGALGGGAAYAGGKKLLSMAKEKVFGMARKALKPEMEAAASKAADAASKATRNKLLTYGALGSVPAAAALHHMGKKQGMQKKAGMLNLKQGGKEIWEYLHRDVRDAFKSERATQVRSFARAFKKLPEDAKEGLLKRNKVKGWHVAAGLGGAAAVGAGAGYAAGRK